MDLEGVNAMFVPEPFTSIPPCNEEEYDLSTRLGRAYARKQAWNELSERLREHIYRARPAASRIMDATAENSTMDTYKKYEYIYKECVWRDEFMEHVGRALEYEVAEAKAHQYKNVLKKPKFTVEELERMF